MFILISTIDVHKKKETYGINRKKLEDFIKKKFRKYLIIRLPAVFGVGLKKNILFDLLNNNEVNKIDINDKFQWFDVSLLYREINRIKKRKLFNNIIELYSPPVSNKLILNFFPNIRLKNIKKKKISYNYRPAGGYYKNVKFIVNRIKIFIKNYE